MTDVVILSIRPSDPESVLCSIWVNYEPNVCSINSDVRTNKTDFKSGCMRVGLVGHLNRNVVERTFRLWISHVVAKLLLIYLMVTSYDSEDPQWIIVRESRILNFEQKALKCITGL